MAKLSNEDILKLAKLSRLKLTDSEVAKFKDELSAIVDYVEMLQAVDVDGLEPTSQVTGLEDVVRPDELIDYGTSQEQLLMNAPNLQDSMFKVKRMVA